MDKKLLLFGKRIAKLRARKNITQEKLAELIGYSPNHISKLESARTNPSFDLIIKIAEALNVEVKELFDYEKSKKENNELVDKITFAVKDLNSQKQKFIYQTIKNINEM